MERKVLRPTSVHKPFSAYSHGFSVEGAKRVVFCAGQVAGDEEGNIVGEGNFDAQGEQVMSNLRNVLAEAGATLKDVVKLTTYVVKKEHVQNARDLMAKHFPVDPPPNTLCVLQSLARPSFLLEIEAIAVV